MNFYDEEIKINAPSSNNLDRIRVASIDRNQGPATSGGSDSSMNALFRKKSDDEEISLENTEIAEHGQNNVVILSSPNIEELGQHHNNPTNEIIERWSNKVSDTESDEDKESLKTDLLHRKSTAEAFEIKPSIDLEKIKNLQINQDIEDIFRHVLKYTPQYNDHLPYQLSPFIPDYVPSTGDVDALLKVSLPDLLKPFNNQTPQITEHLSNLGLHVLDEPSGTQSEPSLLNIKLNTVFSSGNAAAMGVLAPIARNNKDIDKWIGEVEQMNVLRSMHHVHLTMDIDAMALDWPDVFSDLTKIDQAKDAFNRYKQDSLSLFEYVKELCNILNFDNINQMTPQSAYIQNICTIFSMYLVTYNAW